jgi:hypothetical protein
MATNSVVPAPKGPEIDLDRSLRALEGEKEVRILAARALAQGFSAPQVAKALGKRLVPESRIKDVGERERYAAKKLRAWLRTDQKFRDLVWHEAVVTLDLKAPLILDGVAKAARRGRVDAARFAFEITGRHSSHEATITNVQVVLQNIPRPAAPENG